jgi:hypothetical protein
VGKEHTGSSAAGGGRGSSRDCLSSSSPSVPPASLSCLTSLATAGVWLLQGLPASCCMIEGLLTVGLVPVGSHAPLAPRLEGRPYLSRGDGGQGCRKGAYAKLLACIWERNMLALSRFCSVRTLKKHN